MRGATQYKTEFIRQSQATIVPKVTMHQFLSMLAFSVIGIGLFNLPSWSTPFFLIMGWAAGYYYNGELVIKRAWAYLRVSLRQLLERQQIVDIQAEWDAAQVTGSSRPRR
ncbi:MAG: hypothetical protein GY803_09000 [Chloroflexi bacterium]|nr:hypothetical protein [Chloroflexota bacterium]